MLNINLTIICVHTFREVFLLGQAGNKANVKANALRPEPAKKRMVDDQSDAEAWTTSKKRCELKAWWDYISHKMDVSKVLDADFNFPTINLKSHWVEQICRYGSLQQYSAERHEQAHQMNLKDGWNAFNHNLNYLAQVINFEHHILCFEIRELDLLAFTQRRENSAASCKVLPSGADLAAPLSSESYAKPELMGPQYRCDGTHPDAMIKDWRPLLDNTLDAIHRVEIYSGAQEFFNRKSCNKMYISDEQLHTIERCIYHGSKVQVEGLAGERISQICWCTGSQSWHGEDRQNDAVWVMQRPGRCFGVLNGGLLWQLQWLFKMKLLNLDGAFVEHWIALQRTTIPENSGNLDPVSNVVHARKHQQLLDCECSEWDTSLAAST